MFFALWHSLYGDVAIEMYGVACVAKYKHGVAPVLQYISMVLLVLLLCSHREVRCCSCVAMEKYGVACVAIII